MQRVYGTAFFSDKDLQAYLTRIEEAKKRDHRKLGRELGLFFFHPVGARRGVLDEEGHDPLSPAGRLHAGGALPRRLQRGEDAADLQQGAVGDVRALAPLPPEHVPRRSRRRADGREGHELPRPHARVRQPGAQLPRPAHPLPRADAAAPQRGVRRAVGPHAGPAVLAGRCALLRAGRPDRRGSRATAPAGASASTTTSASCRR